eukprot:GDKJ01017009.1.p1 GENE.GDKJ01017009.1~~GDKJ01017009.1.p1  ORF type:complete len:512 (+),score=130.19 GDKJ01017009.1:183-1718(+)
MRFTVWIKEVVGEASSATVHNRESLTIEWLKSLLKEETSIISISLLDKNGSRHLITQDSDLTDHSENTCGIVLLVRDEWTDCSKLSPRVEEFASFSHQPPSNTPLLESNQPEQLIPPASSPMWINTKAAPALLPVKSSNPPDKLSAPTISSRLSSFFFPTTQTLQSISSVSPSPSSPLILSQTPPHSPFVSDNKSADGDAPFLSKTSMSAPCVPPPPPPPLLSPPSPPPPPLTVSDQLAIHKVLDRLSSLGPCNASNAVHSSPQNVDPQLSATVREVIRRVVSNALKIVHGSHYDSSSDSEEEDHAGEEHGKYEGLHKRNSEVAVGRVVRVSKIISMENRQVVPYEKFVCETTPIASGEKSVQDEEKSKKTVRAKLLNMDVADFEGLDDDRNFFWSTFQTISAAFASIVRGPLNVAFFFVVPIVFSFFLGFIASCKLNSVTRDDSLFVSSAELQMNFDFLSSKLSLMSLEMFSLRAEKVSAEKRLESCMMNLIDQKKLLKNAQIRNRRQRF